MYPLVQLVENHPTMKSLRMPIRLRETMTLKIKKFVK